MLRLLPLLFVACIAKERIVPVPAAAPASPQATVNGVKLWANSGLFPGAPSDVEAWVLSIGMDIENTGSSEVYFNLDDFRLVDDLGNVTAPFFTPVVATFPPWDAEAVRQAQRARPPEVQFVMGGLNSSVFQQDNRRAGPSGAGQRADSTGMATQPSISWKEEVRFVSAPKVLALRALTDRPIPAGKRIHGYLYFPRSKAGAKKITLQWKPAAFSEAAKATFDIITVQ